MLEDGGEDRCCCEVVRHFGVGHSANDYTVARRVVGCRAATALTEMRLTELAACLLCGLTLTLTLALALALALFRDPECDDDTVWGLVCALRPA